MYWRWWFNQFKAQFLLMFLTNWSIWSESDISKRLTFSSVATMHSYISVTSKQWLHDFNWTWTSGVGFANLNCGILCHQPLHHKHDLHRFYIALKKLGIWEMGFWNSIFVIFARQYIRIHPASPLDKTDRDLCQKRWYQVWKSNVFIRIKEFFWFYFLCFRYFLMSMYRVLFERSWFVWIR